VIEVSPYLEPMMVAVPERRLCVALVDRATARVFCGSEAGLEEVEDVRDDVHGQHDQGGWSQARYQRSVEDSVDDHLRNVAAHLLELHREGRIERLVVGCTEELLPRFLDKLHSYLRERFAGRIEIDVQSSLAGEVLAKARVVLQQEDERRERELFERPRCGWMGTPSEGEASPEGGRRCPIDGGELEQTGNVVEKALERTLMLSGTTWMPRFETDLEQWGGIAALLRF